MKETDLVKILNDIDATYQGIEFMKFYGNHKGRLWVQIGCERPDINTGIIGIGKGGKAYVSEYAIEDEIVKKIFGLCLAYVEHETREGFEYKGIKLFNPHTSIYSLMEASKTLEKRKTPSIRIL